MCRQSIQTKAMAPSFVTDVAFESVVVRSDWHEDKNLFVVACQYRNRSITPADYQALLDAPDWQLRPLI